MIFLATTLNPIIQTDEHFSFFVVLHRTFTSENQISMDKGEKNVQNVVKNRQQTKKNLTT